MTAAAAMPRPRRKTKAEWIADVERKERHLLARKLASREELALTRPRTRSAPLEAWILHYAKVGQLLGREDRAALSLEHQEADALIVAALTSEPVPVALPPVAGEPREVAVHPKSYATLLYFFHVRDWLQTNLTVRYRALREAGSPVDADLLVRVAGELAYQQGLLAWAACTPGPGLPDALAGQWHPKADRPAVPEPFASLQASDLLRIHEAFLRVNAGQLQALDRLVDLGDQDAAAARPSWSIFFGKLGMKLKTPPERLMRDVALASLLATVKLAADGAGDVDTLEDAAE